MITYSSEIELTKSSVYDLYQNVHWTNYTNNIDVLMNAISHSLYVYCAFDNDILIGLIRVVGDGFTIVYIQDILVNNAYQRKGIGRVLITHILNKYNDVRQIVLMTDNEEKNNNFYKSFGLKNTVEVDLNVFVK